MPQWASPAEVQSRRSHSLKPLYSRGPTGALPNHCYAERQGCAIQLCLCLCLCPHLPSNTASWDLHLSWRGELPQPSRLRSSTWGLRRTEESRPALTSQVGLGSDWSHQPRQRGPGILMRAAPSLEVHHPVEQRSHHPDIIHNLPILVIGHLLDVHVGPVEDV